MYKEAGVPLKTFNTGGDEVPKGAWAGSPMCLALMKTTPEIKDPLQFQGYFLGKALEILKKYGLKTTGWEEVVLNKDSQGNVQVNPKFVGQDVYPLVWDNTGNNIDLGNRIANAGYPVILCNVTNLYFDLAYNTDPYEKGLHWGGFQDAIDPYVLTPLNVFNGANYDWFGRFSLNDQSYPGKEQLKPENRKNIYGLSAQLWSETLIHGQEQLEYYVLPKLFAFAEKAWASAPGWEEEASATKRVAQIHAGWSELAHRIGLREMPRLDAVNGGYAYRISPPGAILSNDTLYANVAFPGLQIRYTTDGTEPTSASPLWTKPVSAKGDVRIRSFNSKGRGSKTFSVK
jgi:hexosaminidase